LAKLPTCREHCFAIHYPIPDGWMNPNFGNTAALLAGAVSRSVSASPSEFFGK
jgi:hypothetical protein